MITDEMIKKSKMNGTHKGFVIIDDNYILIEDSKSLINVIPKTERLRTKGVNYCGPIEYRIEDGKYYFLECRAKGHVLRYSNVSISWNENLDVKDSYYAMFEEYMSILRLLAKAPLEQYIKFFKDIDEMRKEDLKPDICSLDNLLYDEKDGFSFIDVYPGNERIKVNDIFHIILNNRFRASVGWGSVSILPANYKEEYFNLIESIISKILTGLKEFDYPEEEVRKFLTQKKYNFEPEEIVEKDNINSKIKRIIDDNKKKRIIDIDI